MLERQIEAHLVARVMALGGEVRKVKWIGRHGAPDRLVMLPQQYTPVPSMWSDTEHVYKNGAPAKTIWVELKATGKKPEPHQAREHERMRRMGQRVVVIDSIEGVEELLA